MKTINDPSVRAALITRIHTVNEHNTAQWGSMSVYQMVMHCISVEEMYLGKKTYRQNFIGKLFGKFAMKDLIGSDKPMRHNAPTVPEFKHRETSGDLETAKRRWIALIEEHSRPAVIEIVHPFFGKISQEQIGLMAYKHTDHHLSQFGVL